jgi:RNA polymerase sigma-70 factor (ECF subfamily)
MNDAKVLVRGDTSKDAATRDLRMRDAELLALARAGDESSYVELTKRASPFALRAVRRILKTEADAEDAIQETLIRSYFKLSSFDGRAQFSTWFTRIAINSALMIRRKHRRTPEVSMVDDARDHEWLVMNVADPRPSPLDLLRTKQEYDVLHQVIDTLPSHLKEGLQVRCKEDASISEIAERLHLSLPATKTRLLRARRYVIAETALRLMAGVQTNEKAITIPTSETGVRQST